VSARTIARSFGTFAIDFVRVRIRVLLLLLL
jgi:hypothetical protein